MDTSDKAVADPAVHQPSKAEPLRDPKDILRSLANRCRAMRPSAAPFGTFRYKSPILGSTLSQII